MEHDHLGQPGPWKITRTLRNLSYIDKMPSVANDIHSERNNCQRAKGGQMNYGKVKGGLSGTKPFEQISTDLAEVYNGMNFSND